MRTRYVRYVAKSVRYVANGLLPDSCSHLPGSNAVLLHEHFIEIRGAAESYLIGYFGYRSGMSLKHLHGPGEAVIPDEPGCRLMGKGV